MCKSFCLCPRGKRENPKWELQKTHNVSSAKLPEMRNGVVTHQMQKMTGILPSLHIVQNWGCTKNDVLISETTRPTGPRRVCMPEVALSHFPLQTKLCSSKCILTEIKPNRFLLSLETVTGAQILTDITWVVKGERSNSYCALFLLNMRHNIPPNLLFAPKMAL